LNGGAISGDSFVRSRSSPHAPVSSIEGWPTTVAFAASTRTRTPSTSTTSQPDSLCSNRSPSMVTVVEPNAGELTSTTAPASRTASPRSPSADTAAA
jgi:hypothetical protein